MREFVVIFLALYYIGLILYITYKKRKGNDFIVQFKKKFLIFYIITSLLLSFIMIFPMLFGLIPKAWTVVIIIILKLITFICVMWYKNFYIEYDANYFIYNNILTKNFKIFYTEIDYLNTKGDIVILEAKNKNLFIINNKGFVKNISNFISFVKDKRQ